jgi:hypothetical protein
MEEAKIWRMTITSSLVFLLAYLIIQRLMTGKTEPVSLMIATFAFCTVFLIIQKSMGSYN